MATEKEAQSEQTTGTLPEAQPAVAPTEGAETTPGPTEVVTEQPPVNWQERYDKLLLMHKKTQNDLRSIQTATMKQAARDRILQQAAEDTKANKERLEATDAKVDLLLRAIESTGTVSEELSQEVKNLKTQTAQHRATYSFQQTRDKLLADIYDTLAEHDEEGNQVIENGQPKLIVARDSAELAGVAQLWQQGEAAQDPAVLANALSETMRVARRLLELRSRQAPKAAAPTPSSKEGSEIDLGTTGRGAVSAKPRTIAEAAKMRNEGRITDNQYLQFRQTLPP